MAPTKKTTGNKTTGKKNAKSPATVKASVKAAPKAKPKAAAKPVAKSPATKSKAAPKAPVKKTVKPAAVKKAATPKVKGAKAVKDQGFPEKIRDIALKALDERKAEHIITIDLTGKSPFADYLLLASGTSTRQVAAMAEHLRGMMEKSGVKRVKVEGAAQGDWVLVDAGDVIIHLFRPEVRRFYNIEKIYGLETPDEKD